MPLETLARQNSSSRVFPSQCNVTTLLHSRAPCRAYSLPSVTRKQSEDAKDATAIHPIIIIIIIIIIVIGSDQNRREETGWGYTNPMGHRQIHRLGLHSHPHECGFLHPPVSGGAVEHAVDRKRNKYATLPASHKFVPIAVETLGPINHEGCEFLLELGRRGADVSGDARETVFLLQTLSVCTKRFTAVAYRGTFSSHPGDEELLP